MKIIEAHFTVRLDDTDGDLDATGAILKLLDQIGFEGPIDVSTFPDPDYPGEDDVEYISFDPSEPAPDADE
jgi:hypothetical protein